MKKAADQKISNDFRSKNKEQQKVVDPSNNQPPEERDKIIDFANYNDLDYTNYWERVVLFFHLDDKKLSELQAKEISSLHDIDLDQVELNSHRSEYIDTVDFYSEVIESFIFFSIFYKGIHYFRICDNVYCSFSNWSSDCFDCRHGGAQMENLLVFVRDKETNH